MGRERELLFNAICRIYFLRRTTITKAAESSQEISPAKKRVQS
jgi:hypothetical protein